MKCLTDSMGELLRLRPSPEMRASLIQEHADLLDKVSILSEGAKMAVEEAEVEAAPLVERAEQIERFLNGDTEEAGNRA